MEGVTLPSPLRPPEYHSFLRPTRRPRVVRLHPVSLLGHLTGPFLVPPDETPKTREYR